MFIADGYGNHRVIAYNSDTGAFTRMWGAYGKPLSSPLPADAFGSPVHKIARGPSGRFYVADRANSRVQEFEIGADTVVFTREVVIAPGTNVQNSGSVWDIGFAPEGDFLYVADGPNFRVWSIDLESFEVLGSTTVHTEYENTVNEPLHFSLVHRFAVEPDGNLLLACVRALSGHCGSPGRSRFWPSARREGAGICRYFQTSRRCNGPKSVRREAVGPGSPLAASRRLQGQTQPLPHAAPHQRASWPNHGDPQWPESALTAASSA